MKELGFGGEVRRVATAVVLLSCVLFGKDRADRFDWKARGVGNYLGGYFVQRTRRERPNGAGSVDAESPRVVLVGSAVDREGMGLFSSCCGRGDADAVHIGNEHLSKTRKEDGNLRERQDKEGLGFLQTENGTKREPYTALQKRQRLDVVVEKGYPGVTVREERSGEESLGKYEAIKKWAGAIDESQLSSLEVRPDEIKNIEDVVYVEKSGAVAPPTDADRVPQRSHFK
ncbi:hypothetical protein NDN08_007506 [Rhodosorus marinus]|uniref:Uncharacterized protein n=1 Tax=Rhodosorus marinus TaxID=101924 RepID=A0AAV8UY18_9RHOD|nr:hypothetical protein NDN08_007506 [Rhodosorus marinus]